MTSRCEYCGKELPQRDFALPGHRPMPITMPCDCLESKAAREAEEAEREKHEKLKAFSEVWMCSGVPEMYQHVKAGKVDFERADRLIEGRSFYFVGKNGRGKTHSACQAAKAYLIRNTYRDKVVMRCWKSLRFITAQAMFSQLKTSWDRWDQNEDDVFQRLLGVDLLVLDDLGQGVPGEWSAANVLRLIDERGTAGKPLAITSQYTIEELSDRYDKAGDGTMSAMMSRLDGWCDVIAIDGPDRRLEDFYYTKQQ